MNIIKPSLKLDKKNKNEHYSIVFKLKNNSRTNYYDTKISVPLSQWDQKNSKVKRGYPNSRALNAVLKQLEQKINNKILDSKEEKKHCDINAISSDKPKSILFLDYMRLQLQDYLTNGQIGTYDKNKSVVNKIERFLELNNNKDITIDKIDSNFINAYEFYIRKELNNSTNTVGKDLKFIKKVINQAIRENIIEVDDHPFNFIKIKSSKTEKNYLEEAELQLIENFELAYKSKQDIYRDLFLFSCECGGIRIGDLLKLNKKQFDGTYLDFTINKTSRQVHLKVPNKAKAIIEKYWNDKSPNNLIFPLLKREINLSDIKVEDRFLCNYSLQVNKGIQEIAKKAGVYKKFSFHASRHTFATRALIKKIPIEIVQRILGHASIKETLIYAKIINAELDDAMKLFED